MTTFPETRFQHGILAAPDRILVATDLTDTDYLLPHVVSQAHTCHAHVTLVHAILPANLMPVEAEPLPAVDQSRIDSALRAELDQFAEKVRQAGIACEAISKHGFAVDVILQQIEATGANRLIMGTHGRGKLAQMLLGSVASELLRTTPIPILAVGPRANSQPSYSYPKNILHPVSLRGHYRDTARFAMDLAQACRADLTLLHVLDPEDAFRKLEAMEALSALAPNGENLVPPVYTRLAYGENIEEILRMAALTQAEWIVVGVEDSVPFWPLHESTAYKVLASAPCPVLTYRAPATSVSETKAHHDAELFPILA